MTTENSNQDPEAGLPIGSPASESEIGHEVTLFAEPVFHIGEFTVTNSLLSGWGAVLLIVFLSLALRAKLRTVPGKLQNVFEMLTEEALKLIDQVTTERALSLKIFPLAVTVFFFIL